MQHVNPILLGALLAALLAAPLAVAQDRGVMGDLERTATATPQEKLQYASDAAEEQRAVLAETSKLLDDARRKGETDQIECINDRLSQIRALAQVTELAESAMREALASGQTDRADHEMRKIAVALGKTRQLQAESRACVDTTGAAADGATSVVVEGTLSGDENETAPVTVDVLEQGFDPPQQSPFN